MIKRRKEKKINLSRLYQIDDILFEILCFLTEKELRRSVVLTSKKFQWICVNRVHFYKFMKETSPQKRSKVLGLCESGKDCSCKDATYCSGGSDEDLCFYEESSYCPKIVCKKCDMKEMCPSCGHSAVVYDTCIEIQGLEKCYYCQNDFCGRLTCGEVYLSCGYSVCNKCLKLHQDNCTVCLEKEGKKLL